MMGKDDEIKGFDMKTYKYILFWLPFSRYIVYAQTNVNQKTSTIGRVFTDTSTAVCP